MFDRISAGFRAASDCWAILRQDKKLLLFPLISGICCILVLLSFVVPMVVARPQALVALFNENNPRAGAANLPWWFYALVFAFYFCNYFVIYFFNAALVYCALLHFKGIPVTVGDGGGGPAVMDTFWTAWISVRPPVPPVNPTRTDAGRLVAYVSTWEPSMVTVSPVENVVTTK